MEGSWGYNGCNIYDLTPRRDCEFLLLYIVRATVPSFSRFMTHSNSPRWVCASLLGENATKRDDNDYQYEKTPHNNEVNPTINLPCGDSCFIQCISSMSKRGWFVSGIFGPDGDRAGPHWLMETGINMYQPSTLKLQE